MKPSRHRTAPVLLALLALLPAGGCAGNGRVEVRSVHSPYVDAPSLPRSFYSSPDPNTADVFLTDLDTADLEPGADLSHLSGRIVQIRLFVAPLAGSTPIASSACSVVVRHVVLAEGAIGVYSGGGFLLPDRRPGRRSFSGDLRQATLRLTGKTGTFADRLGAATLDASFSAPRDEASARRIASVLDRILMTVEDPGPPGVASAGP